jgi:DNA invertase Pin-like site-specific DNA recombinase
MAKVIPAVAYYRNSDDKQEQSIPTQRAEVHAYATRHNFAIIREYQDDGISGDATEKRLAFQQMLRDAGKCRDFEAILCWDQDRFGRFDPLEAGFWIKPLRDVGVRLETVAQGRIDWDDFAGQLLYTVQQGGKHQYLRDLSRNVMRGMLAAAREGRWQGGPAPYGYKLKGRNLVLGDPRKVEVIRWLFQTYATRNVGIRMLCAELQARGAPPPGDKPWGEGTVYAILKNRKYCGDYVWNTEGKGKYHRVRDGQIRLTTKQDKKTDTPAEHWIVTPNAHPAIISRELFEQVQAKMVRMRKRTGPCRECEPFLLSGLLICGHCGFRMMGHTIKGGRYYVCSGWKVHGRSFCGRHCTSEKPLVDAIVRKLQTEFLNPENLERLRAELRRQRQEVPRIAQEEARRVRRRLTELNQRIERGTARLTLVGDEIVADLAAKVRELKTERDQLAAQLTALDNAPTVAPREEQIDRDLANLWRLREALADADQDALRTVLDECIEKVELRWRHEGTKKKVLSRFKGGVISLRQAGCDGAHLLEAARPRRYTSSRN